MTYKERKTLLDKIICEVALNKHIDKYKINEGYELNNQMNNIVSRYLANNNKIDSVIEGMLMPFIIRSSV
jgi:ribosomal protein S25